MGHFGAKLRELRKKRGLSQIKLATAAGISPSYLSRIERGERGLPHPATLASLAKSLSVNVADLLNLAGYDMGNENNTPLHWHLILADPALDETIRELGILSDSEMLGLQLYLQAIKLHRAHEQK